MSRSRTSEGATGWTAWTPLAVLLVGAAFTAVVAQQLAASNRARDHQRFEAVARRHQAAAQRRADVDRELLRALQRMETGHDGYADPQQFGRFLEAVRPSDYPAVGGVGYCRHLDESEVDRIAGEERDKYYPDFRLTPAGRGRQAYFPIILTGPSGPADGPELGLDLFVDPDCRAAMERACDTGTAVATDSAVSSPLVRDADGSGRPGLLIFAPVYQKDSHPADPADPAARRQALHGFVYVEVRVAELFADDPGPAGPEDAEFVVHDGDAHAHPLYQSRGYDAAAAGRPKFTATVPVAVAGRTWTLTALSTPAFDTAVEPGTTLGPGVVAAGGAALTLLLAALTRSQVRARAAAARAARAAAAAAGRLDLVLGASGVGLWYCDLPTGRMSWDERAKALFFLSGEPAVTLDKTLQRVHPDDRQAFRSAVDRSIAESAAFDVEYRTVSPDGLRTNFLHSVGHPAAGPAAAPRRFDVLTTDVTALKHALEQAERGRSQSESARALAESARAQAEHAGRIKDEFLATLSHELRTPLNAILGWAQLLRRHGGLQASVDEGLAVIERNARLQTQLVSDLLDMSRILAGKIRLDLGPVDMAAVAAEAAESIRPAAGAKNITIEQLTPTGSPGRLNVWGDAARLQQVIWNLLTNAVKFTPDGGRVRLSVNRSAAPAGRVTLTVTDTGGGIDPTFLPNLFNRFSQAEGGSTRRHGGLGLGLAIVKHLVELHGGRVWAASGGLGSGSTFSVELPAAPSPAQPNPPHDFHTAGGQALAGLTVLVADDEPDALELTRLVLSDAGATVLVAAGAEEALDAVRQRRPDVLVGDIGMPGRDGYALAQAIRALPPAQGGSTPAVALTAFAGAEDGRRVLDAGYQVHLPKPAEPADLVRIVARLAGRGPAAGKAAATPPPPEAADSRRERLGLDT